MALQLRRKPILIIKMILQIAFLFGLSEVGTELSTLTHAPIPGSIWGLVILLILLKFNVIQLKWVDIGGNWLIQEMLLFFVPSSVGILTYGHLLETEGLRIILTIVASTAFVMLVTGTIADVMWKRKRGHRKQHASETVTDAGR